MSVDYSAPSPDEKEVLKVAKVGNARWELSFQSYLCRA